MSLGLGPGLACQGLGLGLEPLSLGLGLASQGLGLGLGLEPLSLGLGLGLEHPSLGLGLELLSLESKPAVSWFCSSSPNIFRPTANSVKSLKASNSDRGNGFNNVQMF